jgi:hypothetical protein
MVKKITSLIQITVDYAIEGFWAAKRRNCSPHTIADYELTFRGLREFLENAEVEEITTVDIIRFIDNLAKRLNPSQKTLHSHWVELSSL